MNFLYSSEVVIYLIKEITNLYTQLNKLQPLADVSNKHKNETHESAMTEIANNTLKFLSKEPKKLRKFFVEEWGNHSYNSINRLKTVREYLHRLPDRNEVIERADKELNEVLSETNKLAHLKSTFGTSDMSPSLENKKFTDDEWEKLMHRVVLENIGLYGPVLFEDKKVTDDEWEKFMESVVKFVGKSEHESIKVQMIDFFDEFMKFVVKQKDAKGKETKKYKKKKLFVKKLFINNISESIDLLTSLKKLFCDQDLWRERIEVMDREKKTIRLTKIDYNPYMDRAKLLYRRITKNVPELKGFEYKTCLMITAILIAVKVVGGATIYNKDVVDELNKIGIMEKSDVDIFETNINEMEKMFLKAIDWNILEPWNSG